MPTEDEANHAEHHPRAVADGQLVGALRDAAELLEMPDRALDDVALAVAAAVEAPAVHGALVPAPRQDRGDAVAAAPGAHGGEAVRLVAGERAGVAPRRPARAADADRVEERRGGGEIAGLAR